jgi:hypothetical protein
VSDSRESLPLGLLDNAVPALILHTLLSFLTAILFLVSGAHAGDIATVSPTARMPVYIFFSTNCPHCTRAFGFLSRFAEREPRMSNSIMSKQ